MMRDAMALSGGGARGAAHVGVLLALEEAGLPPGALAGTSAGAVVAGLYACGLGAERLRRLVEDIARGRICLVDPAFLGIVRAAFQLLTRRHVTLPGLIKGGRLERLLRRETGGMALRDVKRRLILPSVDLRTGGTVAYTNTLAGLRPLPHVTWRADGPVCEAARASAAFPAVFFPVRRGSLCLTDGGVADNLPVDLLLAAGERRVLAVDVAEAYHPPEHDNLIEIASHSLTIMSTRLKEHMAAGERFLLHPALPEEAGLLTFREMPACMEAGYEATRRQLPVLRALFG